MRNGAPLLRAGVVHDLCEPSPWVKFLFDLLKQLPNVDVQLFRARDHNAHESKRPPWLVERIYAMSRSRFDPFGQLTIYESDSLASELTDAIRAADCDLIIWLAAFPSPHFELQGLAKHGLLTVRLGNQNLGIPFWDEVANGVPTSAVTVFWHDRSFTDGYPVRQAETQTQSGIYITANAEQPLAAAIRMLSDLCLEIQDQGTAFCERVRRLVPQLLDHNTQPTYPSNFDAARFIVKKLSRSARLRWTTRGKTPMWFVALRPNRGDSMVDPARLNLAGFQAVPFPRGVESMADPFLVEMSGRHYLLFEEQASGKSRGRLGCTELRPDGSYSDMTIVLERPYHLSYPCIVPSKCDLFLLPETCEANRVELYRFRRFPDELEWIASPIEGVGLVDTTPIFVDGRWYFFTTTLEPFMETLLLSAVRLEGPWSLHPCNPISTSVRNCRSSGQLFWNDGRLFRPTQDCSVRYGYAITVNEVTRLTPDEFEERPASYIPPAWAAGLRGTHTWNVSNGFQVLDGLRLVAATGGEAASTSA